MAPDCFIEPFGYCISHANAVSAAFVTAVASIFTSGLNIYFDSREAAQRRKFEERQAQAASAMKLKEESWGRVLNRLEQAFPQLDATASGLIALVDDGPNLSDFKMIQERQRCWTSSGIFKPL